MGMNTDAVQRLYVAYFNRPADPVSLAVYEALLPSDRVATQAELQALAELYFSPSAEYNALYAGMSNSQIVNALYQNLFGRDAEPAGLVAWAQLLQDGTETIASIALQLTYAAQGTDADAIAGKIKAANAFTTEVATDTNNITGYAGNDAAASARSWLATVTDDASADAAILGVEAAVAAAIAADTTSPTFSLTGSAAASDEGQTVYFTLDTDNVAAGTQYTYTLSGTNITNGDVDGSLTGTVTIDAEGKAVIAVDLSNDSLTEGTETMTVSVAGQTATLNINDTSQGETAVTYAVTASASQINEGDEVTFTITPTGGQGPGSTVAWYIDKVGSGEAASADWNETTNGVATVTSDGNAYVTLTASLDNDTEAGGNEVYQFSVLGGGNPSVNVQVVDTSTDSSQVLVLTTGVDSFTGGTNNDVFSGALDGGVMTLGLNDSLNGNDGNDVLNVGINNSLTGSFSPTLASIETVNLVVTAASALDMVNATGVNTVSVSNPGNSLALTNLAAGTDPVTGTAVNISNNAGQTISLNYAAVTGTSDVANVTANTVTGVAAINGFTGIETVNLTSTGANAIRTDMVAGTTIDLAGDTSLTLAGAGGGDLLATTVDASDYTGALTVTMGNTANTVTGGSGNDVITGGTAGDNLSGGGGTDTLTGDAGNDSISGGLAADSITAGGGSDNIAAGDGADTIAMAGNLTVADTIAGGDGADVISANAIGTSGDALFANITSVEALTLSTAGTNTLGTTAETAGVRTVTLAGGGAETVAATAYTAGVTVNLTGAQQVSVSTGTGDDTIAGDTTSQSVAGNDTIAAGTGNDTLSLQTDAATIDFDNVTGVETISLQGDTTGTDTVTVDIADITATTVQTINIDATGLGSSAGTGTDTFTLTDTGADGGTSLNVTGSANSDSITTGDNADTISSGSGIDSVSAGGGNDSVTGGAVADSLDGGAGNDTIVANGGADVITVGAGSDNASGGEGNDTFTMAANFGSDTIAGGDGDDVISANAIGTSGDALFANTTEVEALTLATAGTNTIGTTAETAGVRTVTLAGGGAETVAATAYTAGVTVNLTGAQQVSVSTGTGDDTIAGDTTSQSVAGNDTIAAGTGNDTLSLQTDAATIDFDNVTGVETISLQGDTTGSDTVTVDIADITASTVQAVSVDASGLGASAAAGTDTFTLTDTGADGGTSLNVTGSSNSDSITVGDNADTVSTGAGIDSVAAGGGNDTVGTGDGNDTVNSGAGNDTVESGAGNDSITSGGGNDQIRAGADTDTVAMGATLDNLDSVNGGDGSDTLMVNGGVSEAQMTGVTNFEAITFQTAGNNTIQGSTITNNAGLNTITLAGGGAETVSATAFTTGLTVNLTGAQQVSVSTGSGNDTIAGDTTSQSVAGNDTIAAGTGNDTLSLQTDAATIDFDNVTGVETVTVVGDTVNSDTVALRFEDITTATATQTITIDASGLGNAANGAGGTDTFTLVDDGSGAFSNTSFNVTGGANSDSVTVGNNADTVSTGAGTDSVVGAAGNDSVDTGTGNDTINAGDGTDTVSAGDGNDTIAGGNGNDSISGGIGNDSMAGGAGADTFSGGAGSDTFTTAVPTTQFTYDSITDFSATDDTVAGLGTGADGGNETFNTTAITLGANATFADYVKEGVDQATNAATEGTISWFQYNGNTYIVQDNESGSDTFTDGQDIVIEIQGLVDLSGMSGGDGSVGP